MEDKLKRALDEVKAEEQLKKDTYAFLVKRIDQKKQVPFRKYAMIAAAIMLVIVIGLLPRSLYFTEAAYLDIDVNPSVELTLNKFNRVIQATAYNEDGKKVLEQIAVKNKTYQDALRLLIDEMAEQGYIQDAELFTATVQVASREAEQEWIHSLQTYIHEVLQSKQVRMKQDVFSVNADTKTHAHEQNLTPAKYLAILEMQEVDPTVTFDSCRDHTIGEIKRRTRTHGHGDEGTGTEKETEKQMEKETGMETEKQTKKHEERKKEKGSGKRRHHEKNSRHIR